MSLPARECYLHYQICHGKSSDVAPTLAHVLILASSWSFDMEPIFAMVDRLIKGILEPSLFSTFEHIETNRKCEQRVLISALWCELSDYMKVTEKHVQTCMGCMHTLRL